MSDIYRKSSLEKISSPDQLDKMISVSKVSSWLIMVGVGFIILVSLIWLFTGTVSKEVSIDGVYMSNGTIENVFTPLEGYTDQINVNNGDAIKQGDIIAIIDGEEIVSPYDGYINDVTVTLGQRVQVDQQIAEIRAIHTSNKDIRCYVKLSQAREMNEGMKAIIVPTNVKEEQCGHMSGYIKSIGMYGESENDMYNKLGDKLLVQAFRDFASAEPVIEIVIAIDTDETTNSGYAWSNKNGNSIALTEFTMMSVRVILNTQTPIEKVTGR